MQQRFLIGPDLARHAGLGLCPVALPAGQATRCAPGVPPTITVDVHQVVHDANTGELISDSRVLHRYRLEDGLIVRMDVLQPPDQQ